MVFLSLSAGSNQQSALMKILIAFLAVIVKRYYQYDIPGRGQPGVNGHPAARLLARGNNIFLDKELPRP
jgi:hypothetical protein